MSEEAGVLSLSRLAAEDDPFRPETLAEHLRLAGRHVFGGPKFGFSTAKVYASVNGWKEMYCGELEPMRWYEDTNPIGGWKTALITLKEILRTHLNNPVFDALSFSCEDTRLESTDLSVSVFEFQSLYGFTALEHQTGVLVKDSLVWLWATPETTPDIRRLQSQLFD